MDFLRRKILTACSCWIVAATFASSCIVDEGDDTDSDESPTVINTEPDGDADANSSDPEREYAEIEICSVLIRFVFEHGEGVEVQFENGNDATVIVEIENETTGGLTVKNCVWPDGEDNEAASFKSGERLFITVSLGEGDLLQYSCSDLIGELIGAFEFCDDREVIFQ